MSLQNTISIVIGSFGIILNLIVILVFGKYPKLLSVIPRLFILNQSAIDAAAGACLVLAQFHGFTFGWHIGAPGDFLSAALYCSLVWSTFPLWSLMSASTINLVAVTIERYLSIVHAAWHHHHVTRRHVLVLLPIIWIVGIACVSWLALVFQYFPDTGMCLMMLDTRAKQIGIGTMNFCWFFVIPFLVISICYTKVALALKARIKPEPSVEGGSGDARAKQTRNVLVTLFLIALAYLVCYSPNQITWYQYVVGGPLDVQGVAYAVTVSLTNLNCCTNPLIYALKMNSFRLGLRRLLGLDRSGGGDGDLDQSHTGNTAANSIKQTQEGGGRS